MIKALNDLATSVKVGQKVVCNGHDGTIREICNGVLIGMVVVGVPGGTVCVGISDLGR